MRDPVENWRFSILCWERNCQIVGFLHSCHCPSGGCRSESGGSNGLSEALPVWGAVRNRSVPQWVLCRWAWQAGHEWEFGAPHLPKGTISSYWCFLTTVSTSFSLGLYGLEAEKRRHFLSPSLYSGSSIQSLVEWKFSRNLSGSFNIAKDIHCLALTVAWHDGAWMPLAQLMGAEWPRAFPAQGPVEEICNWMGNLHWSEMK